MATAKKAAAAAPVEESEVQAETPAVVEEAVEGFAVLSATVNPDGEPAGPSSVTAVQAL